jgi:hypothetical protein
MTDILQHVVARDPTLAVVGIIDAKKLSAHARRTRADVVVVAQKAKDERDSLAALLRSRPRLKVLTIVANGESGTLYELRPRRTFIGDISMDSLSKAIRGPPAARRKTRRERTRKAKDTVSV